MWGVLIEAGMALFRWALPRVLSMLGVVAISSAVFTPAFAFLQSRIIAQIGSLGGEGAAFFQYCGVQDAVAIFFSAITLRLGIRAMRAASAKKAASDA